MKATRTDVPLWELRGIYKRFPGVQALEDVSMTIREGQIHALVGENGCGKSTLVKCLSGAHQAEAGDLIYRGEIVEIPHPFVARDFGVATIYQEFSLVPTLTVAENIFLGRQPRKSRLTGISWKEMRSRTGEILDQLAIDIDPEATVRDLSVAEQQLVEIVKAISADSSLLIMDEPTAALGLSESQRLHELIKRFADDGQAILYISHRLDDVFQIADHITVLKDGRLVGDKPAGELQPREVISLMVGFDIAQHYPKEVNVGEAICLDVKNMSTEAGVRNVSFDIRRGEVFGLGGMVGSKRTDIALGLFGVDRLTGGELYLDGKKVSFPSPAQAIKAGVGLIPENRKEDGLLFNFEAPTHEQITRAEAGETVIIEDWDADEFRALLKLDAFADRYLYVSRDVDGDILSLLDETQESIRLYNQLESERGRVLFEFGLLYLGFAVILILAAIWLGMWFAERLSQPVGRLAGAAWGTTRKSGKLHQTRTNAGRNRHLISGRGKRLCTTSRTRRTPSRRSSTSCATSRGAGWCATCTRPARARSSSSSTCTCSAG